MLRGFESHPVHIENTNFINSCKGVKLGVKFVFYTIYKTTNLLNGKIYIGKHQTKDLNDGYMGSGINITRAIKKYGVQNFEKHILFVFQTEEEMNLKEAEIVDDEFVLREDTYNICAGGKGGWGYYNKNFDSGMKGKKQTVKQKNTAKKTMLALHNDLYNNASKKEEWKKSLIGRNPSFKGKTHNNETKEKMSAAKKGKYTGEKNSQFGTMWITNGKENKKIKKDSDIPDAWYKGRVKN